MNTLKYNNFIGTFGYNEDEDILHGKIEGINDLVTFEGKSIDEIKDSFTEAVDDYIELCKEVGKDPLKSFKGTFNVRLKPVLHRKAYLYAKEHNMNLNQLVSEAISRTVDA